MVFPRIWSLLPSPLPSTNHSTPACLFSRLTSSFPCKSTLWDAVGAYGNLGPHHSIQTHYCDT